MKTYSHTNMPFSFNFSRRGDEESGDAPNPDAQLAGEGDLGQTPPQPEGLGTATPQGGHWGGQEEGRR